MWKKTLRLQQQIIQMHFGRENTASQKYKTLAVLAEISSTVSNTRTPMSKKVSSINGWRHGEHHKTWTRFPISLSVYVLGFSTWTNANFLSSLFLKTLKIVLYKSNDSALSEHRLIIRSAALQTTWDCFDVQTGKCVAWTLGKMLYAVLPTLHSEAKAKAKAHVSQ